MPRIDDWETLTFACFKTPLARVEAAPREVLADHIRSGKHVVEMGLLDLDRVRIGDPNVGGRIGSGVVLFSPAAAPAFCCFVSDTQDGWATLVNLLSEKLWCDAFRISTSLLGPEYPMNQLVAYSGGECIRVIYAMRDDPNWVFFSEGALLPMERPGHCTRRRMGTGSPGKSSSPISGISISTYRTMIFGAQPAPPSMSCGGISKSLSRNAQGKSTAVFGSGQGALLPHP